MSRRVQLEASPEVREYIARITSERTELRAKVAQLEGQYKAVQEAFNDIDDDLCCAKVYQRVLEAENKHFLHELNVLKPGFRKVVENRRQTVANELIGAWHRREKRLRKTSDSDTIAQLQHRKNFDSLRNAMIELELSGNLTLDIQTVKEVCKRADYIKEFVRVEKVINDARDKLGGVDYLIFPKKSNKTTSNAERGAQDTSTNSNTGSHKRAHIDFDGDDEGAERKRVAVDNGLGQAINSTHGSVIDSEQKSQEGSGVKSMLDTGASALSKLLGGPSAATSTGGVDVKESTAATGLSGLGIATGVVAGESQKEPNGTETSEVAEGANQTGPEHTTADTNTNESNSSLALADDNKGKDSISKPGKATDKENSSSEVHKGLCTDVQTAVVLTWFAEIAAPSEKLLDMLDDQDFRCGDLIVKRGKKRIAATTVEASAASLVAVPEKAPAPPSPQIVPERERVSIPQQVPVQQYRPAPPMSYAQPPQHMQQHGVQQRQVQAPYMHPSAETYAPHTQYPVPLTAQPQPQMQHTSAYNQEYVSSTNERYTQAQAQLQKHQYDDDMRIEGAETLHVRLDHSASKVDKSGKRSMPEHPCPDCDLKFKYMKPFENHVRQKHGKELVISQM